MGLYVVERVGFIRAQEILRALKLEHRAKWFWYGYFSCSPHDDIYHSAKLTFGANKNGVPNGTMEPRCYTYFKNVADASMHLILWRQEKENSRIWQDYLYKRKREYHKILPEINVRINGKRVTQMENFVHSTYLFNIHLAASRLHYKGTTSSQATGSPCIQSPALSIGSHCHRRT
jgi:hypothetical protein